MNRRMSRCTTILTLLLAFAACSCNREHPGFSKGDGELYYKFHERQEQGQKILIGDEVTVNMKLYTPDTIFLTTLSDQSLSNRIVVETPVYPGDIYTALLMMGKGDSATFILKGNDLFLTFFRMQELPDFMTDSMQVFMDIRITDRMPKAEVEKRNQILMASAQKLLEENKRSEPEKIAAFLAQNHFKAKPTSSGLYYIETRAGKGRTIRDGDTVTVQYVAKLTDGKIIETSLKEEAMKSGIFDSLFEYIPFTFVMGDDSTIAGWQEGISYMRKGGKATLVVPSQLAYGEEGLEDLVPPFTPVVYEIEVFENK